MRSPFKGELQQFLKKLILFHSLNVHKKLFMCTIFYSWTTFHREDTAVESCACLVVSTAMLICGYTSLVRNARAVALKTIDNGQELNRTSSNQQMFQATVMTMTIVVSQKLI